MPTQREGEVSFQDCSQLIINSASFLMFGSGSRREIADLFSFTIQPVTEGCSRRTAHGARRTDDRAARSTRAANLGPVLHRLTSRSQSGQRSEVTGQKCGTCFPPFDLLISVPPRFPPASSRPAESDRSETRRAGRTTTDRPRARCRIGGGAGDARTGAHVARSSRP